MHDLVAAAVLAALLVGIAIHRATRGIIWLIEWRWQP